MIALCAGTAATALLAACGGQAATTSSTAASSQAAATSAAPASSSAASSAVTSASVASSTSAAATSSVVASSSGSSAAPATSTAPTSTAAAQAAPQTGGQEVVWSCYTLGDARNAILQNLANTAATKTGLKITLKIEPGDHYWDNLQTRVAGGGAPDVVVNQVDWVQPGAARNIFVALDSYMGQDSVKREDYNDYKSWLYQGKIYGLPFQALGEMVFINKKLFKDAGVAVPTASWDWTAMLDAATKLTKGEGPAKQFGLHYGYLQMYVNLGTFVLNNGGMVLNQARDKALYGDDPKAIAAAQWVVDTMLKTKLAPTPASLQGQPDPMTTGHVAMEVYSFFAVANVQKGIGDDNMDILPIPKGPAADTVAIGSNAWSIVGTSKVRDQSWKLVNYLQSSEGQTVWAPSGTPALNSVATSDAYLKLYPNQKDNLKLILNHWNTAGRDYFITPDTDDWWNTSGKYLTPMYTGEKTAPAAMKESADAVNTQVFAKRAKS